MQVYEAVTLSESEFEEERVLVRHFADAGDLLLIVGEEGAGKSVLAQQLAFCLVSTSPFLGLEVPAPQRVLYLNAEGHLRDVADRLRRMRLAVPIEPGLLHVAVASNFRIDRPDGLAAVDEAIRRTQAQVLIVDPLYLAAVGSMSDETEARNIIAIIGQLRLEHGLTVVLVAHPPKATADAAGNPIDQHGNPLGSRYWRAAADRIFHFGRSRDRSRYLLCTKDKTGRIENHPLWSRPVRLVMVEPEPLLYVRSSRRPSEEKIAWRLRLHGPQTVRDLAAATGLSETSVRQALESIEARQVGGWPPRYEIPDSSSEESLQVL